MKILATTDGSKYGRWAIEWLADMPFIVQPVVRVLHVVDVASVRAPFMVQPIMAGTERYVQSEVNRLEKAAKAAKEESIALLAKLGLNGGVSVERGAVAGTIMKYAERGASLLSIGSRGLDALDRFMLGSVSNHAIHHAPCSVLVVKERPRSVRRIVLAIDGSAASEKALKFLMRQMNPTPDGPDREPILVTIVHAMPYLKYPEVKEAGKQLMQRYGEKLVKSGFQIKEALKLGKPADEILNVAKREKADLIVTGAKGLGAIGRVLLGSVSTRVVQHAHCGVLVVR
ncbi:MAG: universal stress protein [Nitrospira sp.]|jgi:nucleotide-binding universal stress UspA family protein|nr:universal stress protein [Nitrospira sp.]MDH4243062.1 universal stress protein [Nitrospira sp.]MDH4356726.1 universal stress protein [Nitrospira sp.]MDH5319354.1 universal stress protein [Nitrospira sp.]